MDIERTEKSIDESFKNGWNYVSSNTIGALSGNEAGQYVDEVSKTIRSLTEGLNSFSGTKQGVGQLKGFVAEHYTAGTFNIRSALEDSKNRAYVVGSNKFASVDVSTNFGKNYSLKFYATGKESAQQQAKNVLHAYAEYRSSSKSQNPLSFEDYIKERGYSLEYTELLKSVYYGQGRIIPADQLEKASEFLKREIAKESTKEGVNRAAVLQNYKETLQNLSDRIKDNNGIASIPLTKEEAETIAALCKEGKFRPEDFGLDIADLVTSEYIFKQALKAGITAAGFSALLKSIPDICKAIDSLVSNGKIDSKQLKKIGIDAITGLGEGFLKGSIASSLTICCKTGKFGPFMKIADANVIGIITVLAFDTLKNSVLVLGGKMTPKEMQEKFNEETFITTNSIMYGMSAQALIPVPGLGFLVGTILGSIVGSSMYKVGDKWVSSFTENATYFVNYYEKLVRLDIESFKKDVNHFKEVSENLKNTKDDDQINKALLESFDMLQIKLPWEGNFDDFMSNSANHLRYKRVNRV